MKKLILAFVLTLLAGVGAMAVTVDEIAGVWQSKSYNVPFGTKMSCQDKYSFGKDGKVSYSTEIAMTMMLDDHLYADIYISGSYSGTYTLGEDSITITADPSTVHFTMDQDKIFVRGVDDEAIAETIRSQLAGEFGSFVSQLESEAPSETVLTDVKVDGKKMTCNDDEIALTFSKKKK